MKRNLLLLPLAIGLWLTACKKQDTDTTPDKTTKQTDQAASTEMDEAIDQVKEVVDNHIGGGANKRIGAASLPCGVVSIDSSSTTQGNKIYKMNYGNKTRCGYKYKSGLISFGLVKGKTFAEPGAIHSVVFTDYKVEGNASGEQVILDGTLFVTNVTGGYVWQVVKEQKTVSHRLRGKLQIKYANNEMRERSLYRFRKFMNYGTAWSGLVLDVTGDTVVGGMTVSETGKTYEGNYDFKTEIVNNFVWFNCGTTYAGPYKLQNGKARMHVVVPQITPTYIEVEAGYKWNYTVINSTPMLSNNCESNSYKITSVIGQKVNFGYQLY